MRSPPFGPDVFTGGAGSGYLYPVALAGGAATGHKAAVSPERMVRTVVLNKGPGHPLGMMLGENPSTGLVGKLAA